MKTIIFDIDGTLTNMWPIERAVLLDMLGTSARNKIDKFYKSGIKDTYKIYSVVSKSKFGKQKYSKLYNKTFARLLKNGTLPPPKKYYLVRWIKINRRKYNFVYATGGQRGETLYVLKSLGLLNYFDLKNSFDKSNCRFSKATGIPFRKISKIFPDCLVITDGDSDIIGARRANIPYIKVFNTRCPTLQHFQNHAVAEFWYRIKMVNIGC